MISMSTITSYKIMHKMNQQGANTNSNTVIVQVFK